jgi:hypothetical protein
MKHTAAAGEITRGCRDACPSGLTTQGSVVRGRRVSLPSAENMPGPASTAADC